MSYDRDDKWTASWARQRLLEHEEVQDIKELSSNRLYVKRRQYADLIVGTMSTSELSGDELKRFLNAEPGILFLANIKKDARILGDALALAEDVHIGIGDYGDLLRALNEAKPAQYVRREVAFLLRAFRQHTRVTNVARLDNRRYRLERRDLAPVIAAVFNDYEFTVDRVRDTIERYENFQVIVASNPNCTEFSAEAKAVVQAARLRLLTFKEFFAALNKPWI